jgi:hypothetical protein
MDRFYAFIDNLENEHKELETEFEPCIIEVLATSTREDTTGVLQSFKESLANKIAGYETIINAMITKDWKATEE